MEAGTGAVIWSLCVLPMFVHPRNLRGSSLASPGLVTVFSVSVFLVKWRYSEIILEGLWRINELVLRTGPQGPESTQSSLAITVVVMSQCNKAHVGTPFQYKSELVHHEDHSSYDRHPGNEDRERRYTGAQETSTPRWPPDTRLYPPETLFATCLGQDVPPCAPQTLTTVPVASIFSLPGGGAQNQGRPWGQRSLVPGSPWDSHSPLGTS